MKRNLSALVILLLVCSAIQAQSKGVEFYHFNSDNIRILESILQYGIAPLPNTLLSIKGQSAWEDRLNFNQETRRSLLGSSLGYMGKQFSHTFLMDYESYYDASDLEPTAYINKNGKLGYRLFFSPIDSLVLSLEAHGLIRNEQDRYIQDEFRYSKGLQYMGFTAYRYEGESLSMGLRANLDAKDMNWEKFTDISTQADVYGELEHASLEAGFNLNRRNDDVFNLVQNGNGMHSTYQKQDEQKRSGMNLFATLNLVPHPKMNISLAENYSEKRIRLSENGIRNNGEFFNDLSLELVYNILPNLYISSKGEQNFSIKDFSIEQNTRHIENRLLTANAGWEYKPYDSLFVSLGINLQRTTFPSNDSWDNDLRSRNISLGWKHYYKELIRLSNWFRYSYREDVYTAALLSANNHSLEGFSLLPEATILLGDRLAFVQSYQIRTDYTNYHFQNKRTDQIFRQLGYKLNLQFDSYPYLARAADEKWLSLPYRRHSGKAFLADLGFAYEENQSGEKIGQYYNVTNKNRKYIASLILKHDIGEFYYSISPQYSWGTWEEYSLSAGTYWNFDNGSFLELSLSPVSEDLKHIDWRSSINLNVIF